MKDLANGQTGANTPGFHCELGLSKGDETAKTCLEYYYFQDKNPRNKFILYRENLAAQHSIESAINQFVLTYAQIQKDYPGLGIGDTATDEAVTREVFKQLRTIPPTR